MKLTSKLLTALTLLASVQMASAYDVVITGSTAARTTTLNTLLLNTFDAAPSYIWTGDADFTKSSKALFTGNIGGTAARVMCSWSGSATGIQDVAQQNNIVVIDPSTTITSNIFVDSPATTTAKPQFAMSDVFQASTAFTSPALVNTNAFVVEFVFIANPGSATAGITNMTPQLMNKLYTAPQGVLRSYITGNSAHTEYVLGTGRDSGSGTRVTALAETGYGVTTAVQNWRLKDNSTAVTGVMLWPDSNTGFGSKEGLSTNNIVGNGGYNSGGEIARILTLPSTNPGYYDSTDTTWSTNQEDLGQVYLISYVGVSDKKTANEAMTYCGAAYSSDNIREGKYTFWSYEHLYDKGSLTTGEAAFKAKLVAGIPSNLSIGSISSSGMHVTRAGGDGASVL